MYGQSWLTSSCGVVQEYARKANETVKQGWESTKDSAKESAQVQPSYRSRTDGMPQWLSCPDVSSPGAGCFLMWGMVVAVRCVGGRRPRTRSRAPGHRPRRRPRWVGTPARHWRTDGWVVAEAVVWWRAVGQEYAERAKEGVQEGSGQAKGKTQVGGEEGAARSSAVWL